ncbi:hypothetical protein VKT23_007825 [Stygiomarasmius scandens]|uniref:Uncharacterized protein n=1 Tax=Marasmiellus scandens TaxID=2682957 RepID=A0ABR1JKP0_9AGAR
MEFEKITDMTEKIVIVTGGSAGLGKPTVKALLEKNATVYLEARDEKKSQAVIDEYAKITGKAAIFLKVDLADLRSVKALVKEFLKCVLSFNETWFSNSKETKLHISYNNGGVLMTPMDKVSFATNVLGHFYLTKLLLPTPISTAESISDKVRVVTLSSSVPYLAKYEFNMASLKDGPERRKMNPMTMYPQSKTVSISSTYPFPVRLIYR